MRLRSVIAVVALLAVMGSLAPSVPPAAAASGSERLDRAAVDAYVSDYLDRNGLPGASVAVVKDGKVLHVAGFGEDDGGPVTSRTVMGVGSVSKSFTAFAVLQLVDVGKVDLDGSVVSYLPGFSVDDPRGSKITVRQLLSHTSGLPNPTIVPPANTLEQAVARTRTWQLATDPGTHSFYSNANYWIAARLVEVVSGTTFATYLDKHVFTPLGMADTRSVATTGGDIEGLDGGHVTAYGGSLPLREMDAMAAGAGGVVTTGHDMARWLAMQTNHGVGPDGQRLLSRALFRESHTPQPHASGYGLGWDHSGPGTTPERISHAGQSTRYMAQEDLVPSSGYGVAVMLNRFTIQLEHPYEISSGIIEITEGGSPSLGLPVPTFVDLALGLLTLGIFALTVRGVRRSRTWARRRAHWRTWRFGLRLLPQAIAPALVALLFLVVPALQQNTATPLDVFALWPAFMVLLLVLAITGIVLGGVRIARRVAVSPR